jgi:hypothetical protein
MELYLMIPPLAILPDIPEDIGARPGYSKTWVASIEDFLDVDLSSVLVVRQGGILLRSWKHASPSKKEIRKTCQPKRTFSFYQGILRWGNPPCVLLLTRASLRHTLLTSVFCVAGIKCMYLHVHLFIEVGNH